MQYLQDTRPDCELKFRVFVRDGSEFIQETGLLI